jgi:ketosteroid isomerase-like protein
MMGKQLRIIDTYGLRPIPERSQTMKKYFTLAGVALLAMISLCFGQADMNKAARTKNQSLPDKALIDRETALWEIVKNKQVDAFRKYYADNFSAVYSDGVKDINQEVEGVRNVDLKSYSLTDTKVVFPNKDTAVLTYKVTVQGSFKGQDISGAYYASSVWVNQGGKWLAILHTEAKAE